MKNCLFLLLLFFCFFSGLAQSQNPDSLRAKFYELKVEKPSDENLKFPFESIKVIDGRFDTGMLGFGNDKFLGLESYYKIHLKHGIKKSIENYYTQFFQPNFTPNGKTLLISIKKLWIDNLPVRKRYPTSNHDKKEHSLKDIHTKFEFYIGSQNNYEPLIRVDTVFQLLPLTNIPDFDKKEYDKLPFLCFTLEEMVKNINYGIYQNNSSTKRGMTLSDVENYNDRMKNIPILIQPVKKGVFLTFDEFINNQPSVTHFTKRKLRKTKIFELADKNGSAIIHYYAYYDGTTLWLAKPLSSLSKQSLRNNILYKAGNSFQLYEEYSVNSSWAYSIGKINSTSVNYPLLLPYISRFIIPRQLDLETGDIY